LTAFDAAQRVAIDGTCRPYAQPMDGAPHILMKIETVAPIELGDFVSLFASVGNQFEKFIASEYPDQRGEARFFVKEVRAGSIEVELIGWVGTGGAMMALAVPVLDQLNTLSDFVNNYFRQRASRLGSGRPPRDRPPSAGRRPIAPIRTAATPASPYHGHTGGAVTLFTDPARRRGLRPPPPFSRPVPSKLPLWNFGRHLACEPRHAPAPHHQSQGWGAARAISSSILAGSASISDSSTRAGASGCRRFCSQSRTVPTGR